jgi:hypothetical protein
LAGATVVATAGAIPAGDAFELVLTSTAGAALAGLLAWGVLQALRRTSFAVQAAVTALAPVLAVAIGVAWASSNMFIMSHDLWVLWVVLTAAGTVAIVTAVLLGRRVAWPDGSVRAARSK